MSNQSQTPMATEPVPRLMARIGTPIVLSMILQAAYNVVDSAYLARMADGGEAALTALSLAFPVQLFMVAVSIGTGVGTNALLARLLGQGDHERANRTVGNAQLLGVCITAVFMLFAVVGVRPYVYSQSAGGSIAPDVLEMAVDYLHICCGIPLGIVLFSVYEKVLQATGRSLYSTIAQITGAVVNIAVDPVLIYGMFGLPAMGVRGAAWATVLGQLVSMVLGLLFHLSFNKEISNGLRYWRPSRTVILHIYAIGLPAIISQALLTVMTYVLNLILGAIPQVGQNAVTVYGLYYKIQQLIIFAAFGVRDAITPIVSFNFGMRSRARVQQGILWGLGYTAGLMLLGCLGVELFAQPLARLFSLSGTTHEMCVACMRTVSLGFLAAGLCIAFQGVFQALNRGVESLIISLCRQVIFVLPPVWALSRLVTGAENISIVWWPLAFGEVVTLVVALVLYLTNGRKLIQSLPQEE